MHALRILAGLLVLAAAALLYVCIRGGQVIGGMCEAIVDYEGEGV